MGAEAELVVALLDGGDLAEPLQRACGHTVVATTRDDHLDVAGGLAAEDVLVVGLAAVPWPVEPQLHAEGSASLPAYTGVVSWHALPALHTSLAHAIEPAVRAGAHVLITAPDPGPDTDPGDLTFLREVAQALDARLGLTSRSIAWRGESRTPTAVDALTSLVEAHGKPDVIECPVAPGTGPDPRLAAAADELGARVSCADLGRATLIELLAEVVATVADHEADTPPPASWS